MCVDRCLTVLLHNALKKGTKKVATFIDLYLITLLLNSCELSQHLSALQ